MDNPQKTEGVIRNGQPNPEKPVALSTQDTGPLSLSLSLARHILLLYYNIFTLSNQNIIVYYNFVVTNIPLSRSKFYYLFKELFQIKELYKFNNMLFDFFNKSELSCICVLELLISSCSTIFLLVFGTVPTVWYFLSSHFN